MHRYIPHKRTASRRGRSGPPLLIGARILGCVLALSHCSTPSPDPLTYPVVQEPHSIALTVEGILEAKRNHLVHTPRIRGMRPEVAFLAPEGAVVKKDEVVVEFNARPVLLKHLKAQNDLAIARAEAQRMEAELGMKRFNLESEMRTTESVLEIARLQLPKLAYLAPRIRQIRELEAKKSKLRAEKTRKRLASLDEIEKEERAHYELRVQQAERSLEKAEKSLTELVLKSPVEGVFMHERNWMTGQKIQEGDALYPGNPAGKIPDLSEMQVNVQAGEIESRMLKKDQRAWIDISSLGITGLPGRVSSVAKVAKPVSRGSKVKQVEVLVMLDSLQASLAPGLTPGLTSEVTIVVQDSIQIVRIPLDCLFDQDSCKVAYILDEGVFTSARVTVVRQDGNFAFIDSGLSGGERLALREPD